jgi:hypothetical protein
MRRSAEYRVSVRIQGELEPAWSTELAGLLVATTSDGTTLASGVLADQAALHGLLAAIRDLGLSPVSIHITAIDQPNTRRSSRC